MEENENIVNRLVSIGEDYNNIKPFMLDYIIKIETYIDKLFKQKEDAIIILKKKPLSVASVSKEIGCSRTTLYNHSQLLKNYIEQCALDYQKNHPINNLEALREENRLLKERVNKMCIRDIKYEILKQTYNTEVIVKNEEIYRLKKRADELTKQNIELKFSLSKTKEHKTNNNILPITQKS